VHKREGSIDRLSFFSNRKKNKFAFDVTFNKNQVSDYYEYLKRYSMNKLPVFLILGLLTFSGCEKVDVAKGTPKCVEKQIKEYKKIALCKDPWVDEYSYQGKTVYVIVHGTCGRDIPDKVIDADCNSLGDLGGFAGNSEINGGDFSTATFVKTIWKE
jgi:hypothetical protein